MWILSTIASAIVAGVLFVFATVGVAVTLLVFLILFVIFTIWMRYRLRKDAATFEGNGTRIIFYSSSGPSAGSSTRDAQHRMKGNGEADNDVYELSPDDYSVEDAPPENARTDENRPRALDEGKQD